MNSQTVLVLCLLMVSVTPHDDELSGALNDLRSVARRSSSLESICAKISENSFLYRIAQRYCQKAKYLVDIKSIDVQEHASSFSRWFKEFNSEQQQWCGAPAVPVSFTKDGGFTDAAVHSWPWMVSLYQMPSYLTKLLALHPDGNLIIKTEHFEEAVSMHRCGGTLISSKFVLTAAHCVQYASFPEMFESMVDIVKVEIVTKCMAEDQEPLSVSEKFDKCVTNVIDPLEHQALQENPLNGVPGNSSLFWEIWMGAYLAPPSLNASAELRKDLKVVKVKSVKHFKGSDTMDGLEKKAFHEDMALLELEEPVKFSKSIRPICLTTSLSKSRLSKNTKNCAVAGWGVNSGANGNLEALSTRLQNAAYNILPSGKCKHKTKNYQVWTAKKSVDVDKAVCAAEIDYRRKKSDGGKTKLCYGDSGGPLICKYRDNRWYQIGILSHGKSVFNETCEVKDSPDIFTKVPSFIDWILTSMHSMTMKSRPVTLTAPLIG